MAIVALGVLLTWLVLFDRCLFVSELWVFFYSSVVLALRAYLFGFSGSGTWKGVPSK